ncbi:hypothetical protein P4481_14700 [Bacillus thuringiensis]|nr:hypothetical protein [Bacillus thuringiensis]MED3526651.1 hypothetical protein [Bacillus thuringiensis]
MYTYNNKSQLMPATCMYSQWCKDNTGLECVQYNPIDGKWHCSTCCTAYKNDYPNVYNQFMTAPCQYSQWCKVNAGKDCAQYNAADGKWYCHSNCCIGYRNGYPNVYNQINW